MMLTTAYFALLTVTCGFDVQAIPLAHPQAAVFIAPGRQSHGDVYVLDGRQLTEYPTVAPGANCSITFPDDACAFDVFEDGGDTPSALAICPYRILRLKFPNPNKTATLPEELFRLDTEFKDVPPTPTPTVIVVKHENQDALALPVANAVELHDFSGKLLGRYPASNARRRAAFNGPLDVLPVYPPEIGGKGAVEGTVRQSIELDFDLPPALKIPRPRPEWSSKTAAVTIHDEDGQDQRWPWFPLKTDGSLDERVLYAPTSPREVDTTVQVRDAKGSLGAKRTYPGAAIVLDEGLPDFNHDGYVDLLLWKAPEPGMSVASLTRAATGRTWPIDLTVHFFSPEKRRYEPHVAGHISCMVPLIWLIDMESGVPLRNCVLRDLDGDGRTDLACSLSHKNFSIWLYHDNGFAAAPEFSRDFSDPIEKIEFQADLTRNSQTALGLRTEQALYVIRAK